MMSLHRMPPPVALQNDLFDLPVVEGDFTALTGAVLNRRGRRRLERIAKGPHRRFINSRIL